MFSSLFYSSVLVVPRLNGCYNVGGAVREPAWLKLKKKKAGERGEQSGKAHFCCLFFGYGFIASIIAQVKNNRIDSARFHTKAVSSQFV